MPNWCKNLLKTSGENIKDIMKDVLNEKQEVDFELILPMPKELKDTVSPSKEPNKELINKYGADNWYDWHCINWGTKWNAIRTKAPEDKDIIVFETPWGPPINWLGALSQKHKGVKFKLQFADEFLGQQPLGEITMVNGEMIREKVPKKGMNEEVSDGIWCEEWQTELKDVEDN